MTVLYIEDNYSNVRVIEHLMRLRPGWRLLHAGLGALGFELALAHSPDLVLLDLHLPDIPGRVRARGVEERPTNCLNTQSWS